MSNKKRTSKKIRAWIACGKTTAGVVGNIQAQFQHKLDTKRLSDGRVAIYPTWSGNRSLFDLFMIRTGVFTEAKIDLQKI
jgi:hypothetical protein